MKISYYFVLLISVFTISCDKSPYTEEEEARLEDALQLHNEAMAIFSQTRDLLAEVTEAKFELVRRTGISTFDSVGAVIPSDTANTDMQRRIQAIDSLARQNQPNAPAQRIDTTKRRAAANADPADANNEINIIQDTTAMKAAKVAMRQLNEAQADLLTWMRNIYKVPGLPAIYDDEKTAAKPAIGGDQNSRMLLTDMEFKEFPEDANVDMVYEVQKEMKDEILRIQVEMKKAIKNARTVYLNAD